MLPGSVIGNTAEFGSAFPGSSPGWAARPRSRVFMLELCLVLTKLDIYFSYNHERFKNDYIGGG